MFLKPPHKGLGTAFHQDNGCAPSILLADLYYFFELRVLNRLLWGFTRRVHALKCFVDFGISDPLKGTGMWIAVDPATEENGTMSVVPKSHRGPTLEHRRCLTTLYAHSCITS
eukprot:COSAG02_NODE_208_length_29027_cov_27.870230_20_plen_113_part_00